MCRCVNKRHFSLNALFHTSIQVLTTMHALMSYKTNLSNECFITYFTAIWALTSMYEVCSKSKCSDFPMYELVTWHLVDVYRRDCSNFGCMSILVSTELVESVMRYCCLCTVVFYNLVMFVLQENIEQRYTIKFCVKLNKSARHICFFNRSLWRCHSVENYDF